MNDKEKINELLRYFNLTPRGFAKKCGINRDVILNIQKGVCGFSKPTVLKIVNTFCEVNKFWLTTGSGNMVKYDRSHYLFELLNHFKINEKDFADSLEINRERIINVLNFKHSISSHLANIIVAKYKSVNWFWLKDQIKPMLLPGDDVVIQKNLNDSHKIEQLLLHFDMTQKDFAAICKLDPGVIYSITNGKCRISKNVFKKITSAFPNVNRSWLTTGNGEMLLYDVDFQQENHPIHLIPFYDDIGFINENKNTESSVPVKYINTGDWFKNATAAIRHYGNSMVEYQSGCILVLKEVQDRNLIIGGRDYVIETNEYRIAKQVQRGKNEEYITAYSTNKETYVDGHWIYEPMDIAWNDIRKIFLVLGYVIKMGDETMGCGKEDIGF